MEQIRFVRDDGLEFLMDGSFRGLAPWGILSFSGFGNIENEITTEKYASGDGAEVTGEYIPQRPLDIKADVKDTKNNAEERTYALSFFNPKHKFTVYPTQNGVTRWIAARLQKSKCDPPTLGECATLELAMICPDPYWNDMDSYGQDIAAKAGGMVFPYRCPVGGGFNTGYFLHSKTTQIINNGHVNTDLIIDITAAGEVVNPKIIKDDAYVRMKMTLTDGDVLRIDLQRNRITLNGENCIGRVDRTSSFQDMKIEPGTSVISFDADSGDANMSIVLYYTPKYLGV
mgnify:CR=1 FL=1